MSYIGNPIVSTDFPVDYKSGNGSTTAFTLSIAPASVNSIDVQISGVSQSPQTYSVSGTTLTFSTAPPTGTNNIVVRHLGIAGVPNVPAVGSVTPSLLSTANAVYWDGSGNVGVGTTSPARTLDVLSSGAIVAEFKRNAAGGSSGGIRFGNNDKQFTLYADNTAGMTIYDGATERMRIDSSGNVGIGTNSPNSAGTNLACTLNAPAGGGIFELNVAATRYGYLFSNASNTVLSSVQALPLVFKTTDTERMRIDSSGNLLVNTTSQIGSGKSNVAFDGQTFNGFTLKDTNATLNGNFIAFYNSAGTNCGGVSHNGTTTVNYITSSDYRMKENITPITDALSKINLLKPVTYTWKNTDNEVGEGFIAHELQEVCPLAVSGEKDAIDAKGNPVYQGIDTSKLVATLTAAIQELNAKVEAQALEIQALKGTV